MKIKITVLIGAVLTVLLIGSCSMFAGLTIKGRVANFVSDLNTDDRANIIDNFSESCSSYNTINDPDYWNTSSTFDDAYIPFAISDLTVSGDTATGTLYWNDRANSSPVKFVLVNDGLLGGWLIKEIWIDGTQQI